MVEKKTGYVVVTLPGEETHRGRRQMYEHDLVMTRILGRPLKEGEVVHHKNGVTGDNRPDNLEVITQSEHAKLHAAEDVPRRVNAVVEQIQFSPEGCWMWTGPMRRGHPIRLGLDGARVTIDRWIYIAITGTAPPRRARRTCGEVRCVLPEHVEGFHAACA